MKKIIIILFLEVLIFPITAQNITIAGKVKASLDVSKVILEGASIELKDITIICDVLVINSNVTSIQINGKVKIKCKKYLLVVDPSLMTNLTSASNGTFTIEKPLSLPNISFNNLSTDLEIKRLTIEE